MGSTHATPSPAVAKLLDEYRSAIADFEAISEQLLDRFHEDNSPPLELIRRCYAIADTCIKLAHRIIAANETPVRQRASIYRKLADIIDRLATIDEHGREWLTWAEDEVIRIQQARSEGP